jgi:hypothetical protein
MRMPTVGMCSKESGIEKRRTLTRSPFGPEGAKGNLQKVWPTRTNVKDEPQRLLTKVST